MKQTTLPDKPSELILLALADLEKCEKMPEKYRINMADSRTAQGTQPMTEHVPGPYEPPYDDHDPAPEDHSWRDEEDDRRRKEEQCS